MCRSHIQGMLDEGIDVQNDIYMSLECNVDHFRARNGMFGAKRQPITNSTLRTLLSLEMEIEMDLMGPFSLNVRSSWKA